MTRPARILLALLLTALMLLPAGSAVAGQRSLQQRLTAASRQLDELQDALPDDAKAMGEFTLFDECAYLIGVSAHTDYWFAGRTGHSALDLDLTGPALPTYDMLAFPAEEPPGIECNEDAEPENTDSDG